MCAATQIDASDVVVLYPALGSLESDGAAWRISIAGTVYREKKVSLGKRILLGLLRRAMKAPKEAMETAIFAERIQRFLQVAVRGRQIVIRAGNRDFSLAKKSFRNGGFSGHLRIPIEPSYDESAPQWLPLSVIDPTSDLACATGRAMLLPRTGLSVISDIDDTIKLSNVGSRRELLCNTFLQEFKAVEGMADVYGKWSSLGAAFHYVSSSPWQLFGPLTKLLEGSGFPEGSIHLRPFRLRDHMFRRVLVGRKQVKLSSLLLLLAEFPGRKFILVGDSGEFDPEIYGICARRHPDQILRIFIRRAAGRPDTASRYERAFRELPDSLWSVFSEPEEIREGIAI